jgi:hypothetical protein
MEISTDEIENQFSTINDLSKSIASYKQLDFCQEKDQVFDLEASIQVQKEGII